MKRHIVMPTATFSGRQLPAQTYCGREPRDGDGDSGAFHADDRATHGRTTAWCRRCIKALPGSGVRTDQVSWP